MKLTQKILRKIKYFILLANYRLIYSKKDSGYDNWLLNKSIIKKTIIFSKLRPLNEKNINVQRTVKFLKFIKKKNLRNVVDFGGGAGFHYFIANIKLPKFNFKWLVIENKTMVKLCNKQFNHKNLFFFNSLIKLKKIDIFFSSCAINYTENPSETIKRISKLNSKYFYFTRTPLGENKSMEFKQTSLLSDNGPCKIKNEKEIIIECKNKIISKQSFENIFKKKFIIISKYIDEKKAFSYEKNYFNTYTYILKKKIKF